MRFTMVSILFLSMVLVFSSKLTAQTTKEEQPLLCYRIEEGQPNVSSAKGEFNCELKLPLVKISGVELLKLARKAVKNNQILKIQLLKVPSGVNPVTGKNPQQELNIKSFYDQYLTVNKDNQRVIYLDISIAQQKLEAGQKIKVLYRTFRTPEGHLFTNVYSGIFQEAGFVKAVKSLYGNGAITGKMLYQFIVRNKVFKEKISGVSFFSKMTGKPVLSAQIDALSQDIS
jgi:hypothetical protein